MKLAANLTLLFKEAPFLQRFRRASESGFAAVEFMWPTGVDVTAVESAAREAGVQVVLFNFYAGDTAAGDRGLLSDPDRQAQFRENVPVALELAARLGCTRLNALVGVRMPALDPEAQLALARENVAWAGRQARRQGATIMIEPLNSYENGPYLLDTTAKAIDFIDRVGEENVELQYDVYHVQRMEGDLATTLERHLPRIGHVQIADCPSRAEPGTGEINYRFLLRLLDRMGYAGWVGLEYNPSTPTTEESFGWLREPGYPPFDWPGAARARSQPVAAGASPGTGADA